MPPHISRRIASVLLLLALTSRAAGQANVTVDGNQTYQTIRGWGGNSYSWILNGWNGWTNPRVNAIAFNELGTTHVRLVTEFGCWEARNDDEDPEHFNWEYFASRFEQHDTEALLVQSDFNMMDSLAHRFGKQVLPGIWNVPDWMVTDSTLTRERDLPRSKHAEFAESVAAYLLWAKNRRGILISEIVLANEPDGYQVAYSPAELRDLIKTVGAKFRREGLTTKIVAPDLASPYYDPEQWVAPLLADSVAASYLSAISYHTYFVDGGPDQWNAKFERIAELAQSKGLAVYFTEIGTTPWNIPNTTWPWAFECLQMWHNVLTHGNASRGYQWALLGRDQAVNADASRNPIFHALQQFFLHVPVAARRVAAQSSHPDLLASAFEHAAQASLTIVLINRAPTALTVNLTLQNLKVSSLEAFRTSAQEPHRQLASLPVAARNLQVTLASQTILTLTGSLVPEKDVRPPSPPTGVRVRLQ